MLGPLGCTGDDDDVGSFADARPGAPDGPVADAAVVSDAGATDAIPAVDAPMNSEGPEVTMLAPSAPAPGDLSSDAVVTSRRITARCRVEPNASTGDLVDPTSVRISAIAAGSAVEAVAQPGGEPSVYSADLTLSEFPNGSLTARCTAADTAAEPRTNSDEIATFLDLGPRIDVFSPMSGSSYARQVDVVFKVTGAPVAAGDTGATPDLVGVEVLVGGTVVGGFTSDATGLFQGTIEFDDAVFPAPLDGLQTLTVRAPNTRSPDPVVRITSSTFDADADGPTIAVGSPAPGELVSGIVTLTATVTDDAGVDPDSVVATVAGVHEVELMGVGGSSYQGTFDTRILVGMVFPTIVVRARDLVGNQSSSGFVVALDNVPPVASLDPPPVRESRIDPEVGLLCSLLFDPVGEDAVNDGQTVAQLSELRARINDLGNTASAVSSVNIPVAGVDASTVQLWVLDASDRALIVDTNNDGICDQINPKLQPTSVPVAANEAAVIDMIPVAPAGSSLFSPPNTPYAGPAEDACVAPLEEATPVPPLCVTTPATRVTEENVGTGAVIYTLPPAEGFQCLGNAFDAVATNISDGWACVAVRAEDALGNVGISAPTRVCFDSDGDQSDGCLPWGEVWDEGTMGALADCTGTYDALADSVDAAADCVLPLTFADDPFFQVIRIDI